MWPLAAPGSLGPGDSDADGRERLCSAQDRGGSQRCQGQKAECQPGASGPASGRNTGPSAYPGAPAPGTTRPSPGGQRPQARVTPFREPCPEPSPGGSDRTCRSACAGGRSASPCHSATRSACQVRLHPSCPQKVDLEWPTWPQAFRTDALPAGDPPATACSPGLQRACAGDKANSFLTSPVSFNKQVCLAHPALPAHPAGMTRHLVCCPLEAGPGVAVSQAEAGSGVTTAPAWLGLLSSYPGCGLCGLCGFGPRVAECQ